MRLVMLGPPAVGKGTQAQMLSEHYGLAHIATGDMLRDNIRRRTPLGLIAAKYLDEGMLVPDEIMLDFIKERLGKQREGYLLDGYPRTVTQAEDLDSFAKPDCVINLIAHADVLIKRISGRRTCKTCGNVYHISQHNLKACPCGGEFYIRDDDNEQTYIKRLNAYERQTKPLIDYYKMQGKLLSVDSAANIETVYKAIVRELEASLATDNENG